MFNISLKLVKKIAIVFFLIINFLPVSAVKKNSRKAKIKLSDYISVAKASGDFELDLKVKESDLTLITKQLNFLLDARSIGNADKYPKQVKVRAYTLNENDVETLVALLNATIVNQKQAQKFTFNLDIPETFSSQNLLIDIFDAKDVLKGQFEQTLVLEDSVAQEQLAVADCDNTNFGDCQMSYIMNSINYQARTGKDLATVVTKETSGKYTVSLPLAKAKRVKILNKILGGSSDNNNFDSNSLLEKISTADDFNFTKLRLKPQNNLTTNPQNGLLEFDGDKLYLTKKGSRGEIATAGSSIVDLLTLTPRVNPPSSPQDGYVYFDASGALCVRISNAWTKLAGAGICQEGLKDDDPDSFEFTDINAQASSLVSSELKTILGFENGQITISGQGNPEYSIAGGAFTSAAGVITNAESLRLRLTSNPNVNQTRSATVTIGGVSDTWTVTSLACPTNFAYIPGSANFDPNGNDSDLYSAGWCVSQYEMSPQNTAAWTRDGVLGWDYQVSVGTGKKVTATDAADSFPITKVTRGEAGAACEDDLTLADGTPLANGQLMTVYFWSNIAQAIVDDGINWSGNTPGNGNLSRGNANSAGPLAGIASGSTATNPTGGTFYYTGAQGRAWRMGAGEASIYDFAGNVLEWFHATHNTSFVAATDIDAATNPFTYANPNGPLEVQLLPSERATHDTNANGVGRIGATIGAPFEIGVGASAASYGGTWDNATRSGVFGSLWGADSATTFRDGHYGFRCIIPLGHE